MYSHTSTCVSCGNNFIVEVVPGQPMHQRGKCTDCQYQEAEAARRAEEAARRAEEAARRAEEEARKRWMVKWTIIIGGPIALAFLIIFACST